MKLAIVLAVVVATANALSPEFDLFQAQAVNTFNQHRAVLMSNSSSDPDIDETCKMLEQMGTQSKCVASFTQDGKGLPAETAAEICKCFMMPAINMLKPLLDLQCGNGECSTVLKAMTADKTGGAPDFSKVCSKRYCLKQIVNTMRDMAKPMSPPSGCPKVPAGANTGEAGDESDMQKGIQAMEDGLDFFCSKNSKGEFCGNTFDVIGKTIEQDCGTNFTDISCVCAPMASGGCCSKTAYNFFQKHDNTSSTEFKEMFTTCGYNINSMSTCANSKKRKLKLVKQQLAFKGIACGKKKDQVAFIVQKLVADKAKVNIGNVGVIIDSCPCCTTTANRRLLAEGDGELQTTVSITGDDVDTAATNLNKAVDDGSMTDAELGGSVDKAATTQAKVDTQESDLPTADENAAGRFAPSLLVAVVIAVMATLF